MVPDPLQGDSAQATQGCRGPTTHSNAPTPTPAALDAVGRSVSEQSPAHKGLGVHCGARNTPHPQSAMTAGESEAKETAAGGESRAGLSGKTGMIVATGLSSRRGREGPVGAGF